MGSRKGNPFPYRGFGLEQNRMEQNGTELLLTKGNLYIHRNVLSEYGIGVCLKTGTTLHHDEHS